MGSDTRIEPAQFKVRVPFILDQRGIIINTYVGKNKTHRVLCLDNNSPSWLKSFAMKGDPSFSISKDYSYNTSTADGTPIKGNVNICDSLSFGEVKFTKVAFYEIPDTGDSNKTDDGVFGNELLAKGIWKFEFKTNMLTFTSSLDSLDEMSDAEIFPCSFTDKAIVIKVNFRNDIVRPMTVDLGYNGDIVLPLPRFKSIEAGNQKMYTRPMKLMMPGQEKIVTNMIAIDTVNINHNWFVAFISSNESVKEELAGLHFFQRYDFVIFDFIHKRIYVAKKVW